MLFYFQWTRETAQQWRSKDFFSEGSPKLFLGYIYNKIYQDDIANVDENFILNKYRVIKYTCIVLFSRALCNISI